MENKRLGNQGHRAEFRTLPSSYRAPSACAKWWGSGKGPGPFGARGRSSVRYGTRLGDHKENWFLLFSTQHTHLSRKEGLRGQPRPGVDANVSAWSESRPSDFAVHTAVSPGFFTPLYISFVNNLLFIFPNFVYARISKKRGVPS